MVAEKCSLGAQSKAEQKWDGEGVLCVISSKGWCQKPDRKSETWLEEGPGESAGVASAEHGCQGVCLQRVQS